MRPASALLIGSVCANVILAGALWWTRTTRTPPPPIPAAASPERAGATDARDLAALRAALASGDAAALTAAGVPADTVRALRLGLAFDRLQSRMQAAHALLTSDPRYWRRQQNASQADSSRVRVEAQKAMRDFESSVRDILGVDLNTLMSNGGGRYAYLSPAKQAQLRRIEQDYDEMTAQIYADESGIQLPSDAAKLKLLREERKRDVESAMTPEEREQFELHESRTANAVMWRYGAALETEDDYKRVFALQKQFDDRFSDTGPSVSAEQMKARRAAQEQLDAQIEALLTPDQRNALVRANDQDYSTLAALNQRLNLPATTTDDVLALRTTYAQRSLDINANPALSPQERRAQLQALATKAEEQLRVTLGSDGAQAYAQRATWLNLLRGGSAFSTNAKDAPPDGRGRFQAVYQIKPTTGSATASRQALPPPE